MDTVATDSSIMSDHQATNLPTLDSESEHLETEAPGPKHTSSVDKPNSKIRDFLKNIGCQLGDTLTRSSLGWKSPKELPKVVIYQSRGMAAVNSLLHLIPLSGAVVLLALFWSSNWADNPSVNATTLQFVAKFHELLMQASLITILLHIVRYQALNSYIPLGALSAGVRGPQLSYLWSLDFLSAITSPASSARRKAAFSLSVSGLLLMTAVVGPSSAVLMIPRPGMPYIRAEETRHTNVSEREIFPSSLDYSHGLNFSTNDNSNVSKIEHLSIQGETVFTSYTWPDNHKDYMRIVRASIMKTSLAGVNFSQAIVTIPTVLSRSQLVRCFGSLPPLAFGTRVDTITSSRIAIYTVQPATLVSCTELSSGEAEDVHFILQNGTSRVLSTAADMSERMYKPNSSVVQGWVPPLWMPSPEDPASLIGVFLHLDVRGNETMQSFATCNVTPFWHKARAWMKVIGLKVDIELPNSRPISKAAGFRPITIATEGIAALNSADWFLGLQQPWRKYINPYILGRMFASAVSEVPGGVRSVSDDNNGTIHSTCCQEELVVGYKQPQAVEGTFTPLYEFAATSYGYGYGAGEIPIRLSVAVITAYCVIALVYVIYIITTGHTSVAWDSATELIVLALQSREPAGLGHVSAGICSIETFRKGVGIRVSTVSDDEARVPREKLELVFEEDEEKDKRVLAKVVRNKAY